MNSMRGAILVRASSRKLLTCQDSTLQLYRQTKRCCQHPPTAQQRVIHKVPALCDGLRKWPYLLFRLKLDRASAAEAAWRSPWVRAPSCCSRAATADAKRCSPEMSVLTMRYLGGCSWLDLCVRPNCCTYDNNSDQTLDDADR